MNLESTVWHSGTQGACLLSNPFYNRRMNRPMSWKTRSVFLFHFCFVIVVHFCGHFINLIVGHKESWFEIFLFVDHICQILLLGKLLNQSPGFCSSGFTTVSYLHLQYANCVNLMEIAKKCLFHIHHKIKSRRFCALSRYFPGKCIFPSQILSVVQKKIL